MRHLRNTILFLALLFGSIALLERLFILGPFSIDERISGDNRASYMKLEDNTLDVVYVGASNVYAYWLSPLAWDKFGLASHTYTNSAMPPTALKYAIQECRKTQPNALYVVNINNFKTEGKETIHHSHWVADRLPLSPEKVSFVRELCEQNGFGFDEALELLFPIRRYHSTWNQLRSADFVAKHAEVGGAGTNKGLFLTNEVTNEFKRYAELKEKGPSDDVARGFVFRHDSLDDLIDYCKSERVSILFVNQPQAITSDADYLQITRSADRVRQAGMDYVDLSDPETIGLSTVVDFKDALHTNAHGAIKYTNYLSRYIIDHYDVKDRRGQKGYEQWDETAQLYKNFLLSRIVRDFEFTEPSYRLDWSVGNVTAKNLHFGVAVNWSENEDADEYYVYRQLDWPNEDLLPGIDDLTPYLWQRIATLPADQTSYVDAQVHDNVDLATQLGVKSTRKTEKRHYDYSVIPVIHGEDGDVYGSYYVTRAGVDLTTLVDEA